MTVKNAISHIELLIPDKQQLKMTVIGSLLPPPIPCDMVNRFDRVLGTYLQRYIDLLWEIKK